MQIIVSSSAFTTIHSLSQANNRQSEVWAEIIKEARVATLEQPLMASFFHSNVLNHESFKESISFYLASLLGSKTIPAMTVQSVFQQAFEREPMLAEQMLNDLLAHYTRDAACDEYIIPLLYFKGFHAIQSYRIARWLWLQERRPLAQYFQHRISELFDVDIHPAANLGSGIMLDHATGLVVGETSVIEDDVSILHGVTLGGSGSARCDRHPKIRRGVLLSAGAKILGNIEIGAGAKIGAGSVVLNEVLPQTTVAGVPAKQVGSVSTAMPSLDMNHDIDS